MRRVLDLDAISAALFRKASDRIVADYALAGPIRSPAELQAAILVAMDQRPSAEALQPGFKPSNLFRASVRAIGSNSRKWVQFLRVEPDIRRLFQGYDEKAVNMVIKNGQVTSDHLSALLTGQTKGNDSRAMLRWAQLLATEDYPAHLLSTRDKILERRAVAGLTNGEVCAVLACSLSQFGSRLKTPGMGPTLASEFLRNIGFSMFKPDRHIRRLLSRWEPEVVDGCARRAAELQSQYLSGHDREVREFLQFAIAGERLTPSCVDLSRADNLVWALGYYIERKGRESAASYVVSECLPATP